VSYQTPIMIGSRTYMGLVTLNDYCYRHMVSLNQWENDISCNKSVYWV